MDNYGLVICSCFPGYSGSFCENFIGICNSYITCQNGGTCLIVNGLYSCVCLAGFTGPQCSSIF